MAATWTVTIDIDPATHRAVATGTRTDGDLVRTYRLDTIIDPKAKAGSAVASELAAEFEKLAAADLALTAAKVEAAGTLPKDIETALNAAEVARA